MAEARKLVEPALEQGQIRVRGARVHNLRDINVDIPRERLVVLSGVSGSGKSSLAFDTLYAEGQRRYIEGLSSYARQFLDQLERPDVDLIDGLPPTISMDQRTGSASPRSTVATITEIHEYLRLLYARSGAPHCPTCSQAIRRQTPEQMVESVLALGQGRKVIVLAPLVKGRKGQHLEAFAAIRRAGLIRVRVDGEMIELRDEPPKLAKTKVHQIEAVVDRLVLREGIRPRLAESIDLALKLGEGTITLSTQVDSGWEDLALSIHYACPSCGTSFGEIEPRTFSFNSPYGACASCDGLGIRATFDLELVVPDRSKSITRGAVAPWEAMRLGKMQSQEQEPALDAFLRRHRLTRKTPLSSWPGDVLDAFLSGERASAFQGVVPGLEAALARIRTDRQRTVLEDYRVGVPCPDCGGARLRPEARAVLLGGKAIHEVCDQPVAKSIEFFRELKFEPQLDLVGRPLVQEVTARLEFLNRVGLGYLALARGADTLSGGELQRVRLATQIGSGLVGVGFILDEPTAGLHPRDTGTLLASLVDLRDRGNSVIVVEHDESTIRAADWLIDLGPGAGPEGGLIVASGPPARLRLTGESRTAEYLNKAAEQRFSSSSRLDSSPGAIVVFGATEHNLQGGTARFPLGCMTTVSGVSGSGKSTLAMDVLSRAAKRSLEGAGPRPGAFDRIEGLDAIDKAIVIDQSPIGRNARSTPVTFTGVFDEIRRVFARTRDAKVRGYGASRFSFNAKAGRCEVCVGQGVRRIEMSFLPDLLVRCEACSGRRFNPQTLEIRYKARSMGDVLEMRVDEALEVFDAIPKVRRGLEALHEAGLGYVTLGQPSTSLSGGEAQRVKLAAELGRVGTGRTLYILDEPTTGLHFADVANLLRLLHRLADLGNTIVVIEHHLDVIRASDWVIDLGPEGGEAGGRVVAMGPPDQIAAVPTSHTGRYLKAVGSPLTGRDDGCR
jgi:excinuclease ABC subunit A